MNHTQSHLNLRLTRAECHIPELRVKWMSDSTWEAAAARVLQMNVNSVRSMLGVCAKQQQQQQQINQNVPIESLKNL